MNSKDDYSKFKPKLTKEILKEAYSAFPNFLFFTTVKPGERQCCCTACKTVFKCGIHVLQRTATYEWTVADSARHGEIIRCPVCGERVKVINTKLQKRLNDPRIEISKPTAFFYGINENDVWVCCYFINRTYSADGKSSYDEQLETNVYHLTPGKAEHYKRRWSHYFGWHERVCLESLYREPFQWDVGRMHRRYNYDLVNATKRKLNDTFLRYSGYDAYVNHAANAPMLQYWCWYCNYPQLEMLSKLGRFETVDELVLQDKEMLRLLNWNASKPWELYKLSKNEYKAWCGLPSYERIPVLKIYRALKADNSDVFQFCRKILNFSHYHIKDALTFARRINKYGRPAKEVFKYFERISRSSAGCCWHCPGISTAEVIDMWIDYINMGDNGARNFNPYPSNLKEAHDALLKGKSAATAKQLRRDNKELIARLGRKYKKANANCRALAEKYSYDNGTYAFVTPHGIADILIDGWQLNQCTARPDARGEYWRYLDRINRKETYIGFVRKSDSPETPWFTIEFEPGGTVRQKRAEHDSQPVELMPVITDFLVEWQNAIASRLDKTDISDARAAKKQRIVEFDELRRTGKTINYGDLAGTLLIEAFEKDLMEIESETA